MFLTHCQRLRLLFTNLPYFLLTVEGMELGRKMFNDEFTDVAALLAKRTDSEEVKQIKKLITAMLAHDPEKRPRIGEVVDRLSRLRTSLGVQVLIAVDTVWQTSIFYRKSDLLYRGLLGLPIHVNVSTCAQFLTKL